MRGVASGGQQGSETVRQAAESAVREVVGNNTMDATLFERGQLSIVAKDHLQKSLDMYRTGIKVSQFNLPDARFPDEVSDAFNEAINAAVVNPEFRKSFELQSIEASVMTRPALQT